jgi:hypothetical protein
MPNREPALDLVFVRSTSAASLPLGNSTALEYNLAGMMKNGVLLIVEARQQKPGTEGKTTTDSEATESSVG